MKHLLIMALTILISACSSPDINDYTGTSPELKLERFFNGKLTAHGVVLDRSGALTRRFSVDLLGTWQEDKGKLEEWFVYDDGEKQTRTWYLENLGDGNYKGTANDVVGTAMGMAKGSALYWRYQLVINYQGEPLEVTLDDWMFLINEKRLINRTEIIKFGIKVGEVILTIEKE
ncbi:DUF3833 domain-containing protein [Pseudoalteromonas sp. MMG024]|uniref:DUF3833 domain-containing protein n=1 Tax=Pseudoalteromonas sp. MMG024 TaxID=2909980 RepID=UPI001F27E449|nr:DUF3833 domain-containing protein [Pseudoalteromonas sp. MMG024]MCF6458958.1 DUF3833 domain-containing protein [Pseudoalteromonas sp. MMG024]